MVNRSDLNWKIDRITGSKKRRQKSKKDDKNMKSIVNRYYKYIFLCF